MKNMYKNIFRRVEEKYLLTEKQRDKLFAAIAEHIEPDDYFETTICSIYFDDINNSLIVNTLEKPLYRLKVRVRSYGIPDNNDDVFLEVKSKYKKVVGKRRIRLSLKEFNQYLKEGTYDHDSQIMREIDYIFKLYDLRPAWFVGYDRLSYREIGNEDLRITVDANLRSRKTDLSLEKGDGGEKYFDNDRYIVEVKTLGMMPLWLVRSLSDLKIYPVSFSKYGNVYRKVYQKG